MSHTGGLRSLMRMGVGIKFQDREKRKSALSWPVDKRQGNAESAPLGDIRERSLPHIPVASTRVRVLTTKVDGVEVAESDQIPGVTFRPLGDLSRQIQGTRLQRFGNPPHLPVQRSKSPQPHGRTRVEVM